MQANSDLVQTQTATVATMLDTRQVQNMPLASRDASQFIVFLPGVSTPDTTRNSSVNGMPQSAINMTLDGVNIQDNTLKSTDGFFAIVGPRIDAIEEITVTTAAGGAESARRRRDADSLHDAVGDQPAARQCVPPVPQRLVEHEYVVQQARRPAEAGVAAEPAGLQRRRPDRASRLRRAQPRVLLRQLRGTASAFTTPPQPPGVSPGCDAGRLPLQPGGGVQTVNLFELAARNGQLATPDPIIAKLFADIRSAMASEGSVRDLADPLYQRVFDERARRRR